MKRMLFNATQAEELRVAIVDGQKLIDLDIESAAKEQRKSNIYKGVITRVEPSLEAAFIDYGAERHGFLPFKEISRSYFQPGVDAGRARISEAIKEGQELIVQVDKDERGNKGAALTTFISLAGRHLVLMPNNPRGGGVSRRVDGDERAELREAMDQLEVPQGMSLIARTAAIGRQVEELQWDLNYLLQLWRAIEGAANEHKAPLLIYQEGSLVIRAIRDYFQPEIGEILIDTDDIFEQAQAFMAQVMPNNVSRVKRYHDDVPLFSRFQIEHQIETAFARQVNLPSGGAIVIDHTEALVAVDVNSGRSTRGADIEETALKTNLEAADEIGRQLRLRDLGGLIVIDFIDMEPQKNQREVENRLRDALRFDRARVQMGKISRFGLMELSRQRLRPALAETSYIPCPRCTGTGHIRSTESAALHILRILEEEAMKDNTAAVHVQVPVDVATFLLNEKRQDIQAIELRHKVTILLIPNTHLETPAHTITRLRHDELNLDDLREPSYKMVDVPTEESAKTGQNAAESGKPKQEAAIKHIAPQQPAPVVAETKPSNKTQPGFFSRILSWFSGSSAADAPAESDKKNKNERGSRRDGREVRDGRDRDGRNGRGNRGRNSRDGREAKADRGDQEKSESRESGRNTSPRQDRGERAERTERQDKRGSRNTPDEASKSEQKPEQVSSENGAAPRQPRERRPRGERGEQGQRRDRQPATDNNALELASADNELPENSASVVDMGVGAELVANNGEEGSNNGRRRNRRGSRNRGERRDATEQVEAVDALAVDQSTSPELMSAHQRTETPIDTTPIVITLAAPVQQEVPATATQQVEVASTQPVQQALFAVTEPVVKPEPSTSVESPIETVIAVAPVAVEPVQQETNSQELPPIATVSPTSTLAQASEERSEPLPAAVPVEVVVTPPPAIGQADLEKALDESGLVMVSTASTAAVTTTTEAPTLGRARRQRSAVAQQTEALVMVETQKG